MSLVQYFRESTFILEIKSYLNFNPGHTGGKTHINKQTKPRYQQRKKTPNSALSGLQMTPQNLRLQ